MGTRRRYEGGGFLRVVDMENRGLWSIGVTEDGGQNWWAHGEDTRVGGLLKAGGCDGVLRRKNDE